MGERGPAQKPTELRVLHGDRPNRINTAEPKPAEGSVNAPTWLGKEARRVWRTKAPDLIAKKVLTAWDTEAFALYCDAVVRHRTAAAKLDELGEVVLIPVYSSKGDYVGDRLQKNPWQMIWKESSEIMLRYGARFGMTPSDRAGISVGEPTKPAGGARLLS